MPLALLRTFTLASLLLGFALTTAEAQSSRPRTGGGDPIQPGRKFKGVLVHTDESNWRVDYTLEIKSRTGEKFTGVSRNSKVSGSEAAVEGIVRGGKFAYTEKGEKKYHFEMEGEIEGRTLSFHFLGTGTAGIRREGDALLKPITSER